jgi:hypothetical protein
VSTSQPAQALVIETEAMRRVANEKMAGVELSATSIVAIEVKTRRRTIGGFVTST